MTMIKQKCPYCGKPYKVKEINIAGDIKTINLPTCNCNRKAENKKEAKEKGIKLKNKIRQIKDCGLGVRFKNKTFKNYNPSQNPKAYRACKAYAKSFLTHLKEGKGLILYGAVGTGKTHLAVAIIDYIARFYKRQIKPDINFKSTISLLSDIRLGYKESNAEQICKNYEACTLLVIDDLGTEKVTDWVHELFYRIIDYRYSNLKPTIFTANYKMSELSGKLGDRLISRIREMCDGVKFEGKDWRVR